MNEKNITLTDRNRIDQDHMPFNLQRAIDNDEINLIGNLRFNQRAFLSNFTKSVITRVFIKIMKSRIVKNI